MKIQEQELSLGVRFMPLQTEVVKVGYTNFQVRTSVGISTADYFLKIQLKYCKAIL